MSSVEHIQRNYLAVMREGDQVPAGTAFLVGRRHALTFFLSKENPVPARRGHAGV